jgi:hypothetical protein
VTITAEQWAAAATDHNMTIKELFAKIAKIDSCDAGARLADHHNLGPLYFDRQCEPITLGVWSVLYAARSYKLIAEAMLPNGYWVATIWQGVNVELEDPPVVMESSVFFFPDGVKTRPLPRALRTLSYSSEAEALWFHDQLVEQYS